MPEITGNKGKKLLDSKYYTSIAPDDVEILKRLCIHCSDDTKVEKKTL